LLESDVTMGAVLKKAGYATGGFGKWGLGDADTAGAPGKHGFDEFFGYLHQAHAHEYYPEYLWKNGKPHPLPGNCRGKRAIYSHDAIAREAFGFLKRNQRRPFFLYLPFTLPHADLAAPSEVLARYNNAFPEQPYPGDPEHHRPPIPAPRATMAAMIS